MKVKVILIITIFSLFSCAKEETPQVQTQTKPWVAKKFSGVAGYVKYNDRAKFPEDYPGYESAEITAKENRGARGDDILYITLKFKTPPADFSVKPGDIVIGYKKLPFYFRKVTEVTYNGNTIVLTTEKAKLKEAIEEADLHFIVPIQKKENSVFVIADESTNGLSTYQNALKIIDKTWENSTGWCTSDSDSYNIANKTIWEKSISNDHGHLDVNLKTTDDTEICVTGGYEIILKVYVFSTKIYFKAQAFGGYEINLGVEGNLDGEYHINDTKHIIEPTNLLTFNIYGIPGNIQFSLEAIYKLNINATAHVEVGFEQGRTYNYFISYNKNFPEYGENGWKRGKNVELSGNGFYGPEWNINGNATLFLGIKPELGLNLGCSYSSSWWLIGDVNLTAQAGVSIYALPYLKLDAHAEGSSELGHLEGDAQMDLCFECGVQAGADLVISFLGIDEHPEWSYCLVGPTNECDPGITSSILTEDSCAVKLCCASVFSEDICIPLCIDQECGDDGCGGSCGECDTNETCVAGHCVCNNESCGDTCCAEGEVCFNDSCCKPDCESKDCGDNGCGGSCGECENGFECVNSKCECLSGIVCNGECCNNDEICFNGSCCKPDCEGKVCGSDGCGGSCGTCEEGYACDDESGECVCIPDCDGKECGDDGCGGSCGCCPSFPNYQCVNGECKCNPNCILAILPDGEKLMKECGPDGCGGVCGECPGGETCTSDGVCVCAPPSFKCADQCCTKDQVCFNDSCCTPNCENKECGDDGCGGMCGFCGVTEVCLNHHCCPFKQVCGDECCPSGTVCAGGSCCPAENACGDNCCNDEEVCLNGECCSPELICSGVCCNEGEVCFNGQCCKPDCDGKECGDDGCGGSCGNCPEEEICESGKCVCPTVLCNDVCCQKGSICTDTNGDGVEECCLPSCENKVCGDNGCGGSCGKCDEKETCENGECCSVFIEFDEEEEGTYPQNMELIYSLGQTSALVSSDYFFSKKHSLKSIAKAIAGPKPPIVGARIDGVPLFPDLYKNDFYVEFKVLLTDSFDQEVYGGVLQFLNQQTVPIVTVSLIKDNYGSTGIKVYVLDGKNQVLTTQLDTEVWYTIRINFLKSQDKVQVKITSEDGKEYTFDSEFDYGLIDKATHIFVGQKTGGEQKVYFDDLRVCRNK